MYELKLVRSVLKEDAPVKIVTALSVVNYIERNCQPESDQWREMAWILTLNKSCEVTGHFLLSIGGTGETVIDKKIVAKVAIEQLADAVILVHNHPSGDSKPSQADIRQTGEVKKALGLFDIKLLDHVIIGYNEFYSFAAEEKQKSM